MCSHDCPNMVKDILHRCPYRAEMNNDDEPFCNCCEDCTTECGYEV